MEPVRKKKLKKQKKKLQKLHKHFDIKQIITISRVLTYTQLFELKLNFKI